MPELPEVETVRRSLLPALVGRRILEVTRCAWPRTIAAPAPELFCTRLRDRAILDVARRAKYVIIHLDGDEALVVHLRMTGRLTLVAPDATPDQHTHVALRLDDERQLFFRDPRKFGRIWLLDRDGLARLDGQLGPEPLDETLTAAAFRALLRRRTGRLKPLLLDQRLIAGLGNIYADEALWQARLHPLQSVAQLSDEQIDALYAAVRDVLQRSIANRGTTFADYRDAWGLRGDNQSALNVYGRAGQPCPRCGTPIARLVVAQRGTHICPVCQPCSPAHDA
ncbi:bifunctional DNA-formamidopyrimidine glycosylase/DNA-(apurinic or apyrimidinic site) lyase [Kallotenue papyrolyticum]|uniref:bifunctional DNA-formamidopyrimidine glycosylase/DNA-(apurinic or apyrimidinic site) lyase n=1 Tax=Kallotenue papyrolyticum TaxID=1325125 RepID=UPI000492E02D|nr:bifunctional DNA-formamidopyrimidine glycosylase/DNA-(apurinic or apyrimidinic site) lyase [Kallotenue papyrolyticum]